MQYGGKKQLIRDSITLFSLLHLLTYLPRHRSLIENPGAPGNDAAAAAVRVRPPAPSAVVVGMATAVAGDTVAREGAVADEPLPAVSAEQEATGVLRLHVQLVVLVEALTHEPVACGRGVPQPVVGAGEAGELPRDLGVDGAHRPRPGHRGRGQDEQEEGEAESHAGQKSGSVSRRRLLGWSLPFLRRKWTR